MHDGEPEEEFETWACTTVMRARNDREMDKQYVIVDLYEICTKYGDGDGMDVIL